MSTALSDCTWDHGSFDGGNSDVVLVNRSVYCVQYECKSSKVTLAFCLFLVFEGQKYSKYARI